MTDQDNELITKWEFLMEDLPKAKSKRYKFARIYEKIVQHNNKSDLKMLLSIAHRMFKKVDDIKMSKGSKNSHKVCEFYESDFYINGTIMMDQFMAYCESVSTLVIEQLSKTEKIGCLQIKSHEHAKEIHIIF